MQQKMNKGLSNKESQNGTNDSICSNYRIRLKKSSAIRLGNTVTYQELPNGATETYKIVGSAEANPFDYKISNESPVAQALLGKEVGDVAKVSLPTGPEDSMEIKILEVE